MFDLRDALGLPNHLEFISTPMRFEKILGEAVVIKWPTPEIIIKEGVVDKDDSSRTKDRFWVGMVGMGGDIGTPEEKSKHSNFTLVKKLCGLLAASGTLETADELKKTTKASPIGFWMGIEPPGW